MCVMPILQLPFIKVFKCIGFFNNFMVFSTCIMCEDITIIVVTRTIKLPIKNISRASIRTPPLCNNNYQVLMLQVTTSDGNQSCELYNLIKPQVTTLLTNDHISSSYSIYECYTIIPPWMWVQGLPYALGPSPRVPWPQMITSSSFLQDH